MFKEFLEFPFPDKWWFVLLLVWVVVWKGMALWKSARLGQKWWFVVLLIVNTFGILEIFYVHVFSKKQEALRRDRRSEDDKDVRAHATAASLMDNAAPVSDDKNPSQSTGEEKKPEESKKEEGTGHLA
jgi:hypothetical protein